MSIDIVWDNDQKTIIRWIIKGEFTWDQYDEAKVLAEEMHATAERDFTTIFDLCSMDDLPRQVLTHFPRLSLDIPEKQERLVVVGAEGFIRKLGLIFSRVYRQVQFANTLEEAYELIGERPRVEL